jgi:hypothetical protein
MKLYYERVTSQEELGHTNDGYFLGLYWYKFESGNSFIDAQWFKTERDRDKFIAENEMLPVRYS